MKSPRLAQQTVSRCENLNLPGFWPAEGVFNKLVESMTAMRSLQVSYDFSSEELSAGLAGDIAEIVGQLRSFKLHNIRSSYFHDCLKTRHLIQMLDPFRSLQVLRITTAPCNLDLYILVAANAALTDVYLDCLTTASAHGFAERYASDRSFLPKVMDGRLELRGANHGPCCNQPVSLRPARNTNLTLLI